LVLCSDTRTGHANFLDTLVEALDVDDEGDNKTRRPPSPTPQSNLGRDEFEDLEELDEDSDEETDSDNWSDESDDDDHALSRTASAQQLAQASRGVREAMKEDDGDYFSQSRRGEGMIKVDDHSNLDIIDVAKKDAVTVVDSLVELTPMVSPADSQSSDSSRDDADVARKP
jgi:hypothetical protein